jgi:hypothetical protein
MPLMLTILLAGCANSTVDRESAIQGRYRISGPNTGYVSDPFGSLAGEYFEFRPHGVVAGLIFDQGPQVFWTKTAGEYSVSDMDQITIKGKCWQGWQSYDCSQTYRFDLKGNSLIIFDKGDERHAEYERIGDVSSDLPPTLIPPMPSATPMGE